MSVNFESAIGNGWLVDLETAKQFNKRSEYKYEDNIIPLDAWNCDDPKSRYFIGDVIASVEEPTHAIQIGLVDTHLCKSFNKWTERLKECEIEVPAQNYGTYLLLFVR